MSAFDQLVEQGGFRGLTPAGEKRTVVLPWPPKALSPNNNRGHWGKRAGPGKASRTAAFYLTRQAFPAKPSWAAVKLDVVFCPPDKRRRDLDNCIASNKNAWDGVSSALGIDDSKFIATYRMGEVEKGGAVRVTIEEGV